MDMCVGTCVGLYISMRVDMPARQIERVGLCHCHSQHHTTRQQRYAHTVRRSAKQRRERRADTSRLQRIKAIGAA